MVSNNLQNLNASQLSLYNDVKDIAQNALKYGSTGASLGITTQWNPIYWFGMNHNFYTHRMIHKRGGYAYSFKRVGEILTHSPFGKFGNILSLLSMYSSLDNMTKNGPNTGDFTDMFMTSLSFSGPWGIMVSATYGVTDMCVTLGTGTPISGWINEFMDEYMY